MSGTNNLTPIWHDTAIKLIRYAGKFKNTSNEFERQVGFLLLDVGVETLFRSYLTMPDTKAKLAFSKREEAAKGTVEKKDIMGEKFTLAGFDELSFHKLVEAVGKVADSSIDERILREAEHYHNIRNKIYHLGEGIVPAKEKFDGYLELAHKLLTNLVDKKATERKATNPDDEWAEFLDAVGVWSREVLLGSLKQDFQDFKFDIAVATEVFAPTYTTKRFEAGLKEIYEETIDDEDGKISDRYEVECAKIERFQKFVGIETNNIEYIDEILSDITLLYILVLLKNKVLESNDLKKYREYRDFVEKFSDNPDEATTKDKEKLEQIRGWANGILPKLYALYNEQTQNQQ